MKTVESATINTSLDLDTLKEIFQDHPVRLAILFGSQASGSTHETSDIDLAVEFENIRPPDSNYNEAFFGLSVDLSETLHTDGIDLVDLHTVSPALAEAIFEKGLLIIGDQKHASELQRRLTEVETEQKTPRDRLKNALERIDAHLDKSETEVPASGKSEGER